MNIFVFLLGIVLGAGAVWVLIKKRVGELEIELKRTEKEMEEERTLLRSCELRTSKEEGVAFNLADFNRKTQEIKENRKQEVFKELEKRGSPSRKATDEQGTIKTNEVADLIDISRATAFRYLEELEKEGKIEQIGTFGRNVEYRVKGR